MSPIRTPKEAIASEFGCYYVGDELGNVESEEFRASIPRRAWQSAANFRRLAGEDKIPELISLLESLKQEPYGALMVTIMQHSEMWWSDFPDAWEVFKTLVDKVIWYLQQKDPGPLPPWRS